MKNKFVCQHYFRIVSLVPDMSAVRKLHISCFKFSLIWLYRELIGKLVLKIPWKNLYSAPVEASVEGLFLLVVPNQEVKYDPVKEEKWSQEAKKNELQRIEDAKKREKEKGERELMNNALIILHKKSCFVVDLKFIHFLNFMY